MVRTTSAVALVDGGMFEMAVDGDGLKHFVVDSPAGSAELMNEQRRYGAEVEIGSVEVGVEFHGLHVSLRERDVAAGRGTGVPPHRTLACVRVRKDFRLLIGICTFSRFHVA